MRLIPLLALLFTCYHALADDQLATSNRCPDLSGSYAFSGKWEQIRVELGDAQSERVFKQTNRYPRLDYHALAIGANNVEAPQEVVIEHNPATGVLTADVPGIPVDPRSRVSSTSLPATIQLHCGDNGWEREINIKGGVGPLKSLTVVHIDIRKETSGELVAIGKQETSAAWLVNGKALLLWNARFRELERSQ